jgi:hypothetical protein
MATDYRKKVMAIVADNNLTVECACRNCISIDFPPYKQDRVNGYHYLHYPDLRDSEMPMAHTWEMVYGDLYRGFVDCPADCHCRS